MLDSVQQATIHIRPFAEPDSEAVANMVIRVFDEHVAPGFELEGIAEMHGYVAPQALVARSAVNRTLVAIRSRGNAPGARSGAETTTLPGSEYVGIIEVRDQDHVSLLFVHTEYMGQGIAKALMARAEAECCDAGRTTLTVNSSLNAMGFYECMGFVPTDELQRFHGFVYVPMEKDVRCTP